MKCPICGSPMYPVPMWTSNNTNDNEQPYECSDYLCALNQLVNGSEI